MVNLFSTYYEDKDRKEELDEVLRLNRENKSIDHIFLLNENTLWGWTEGGEKREIPSIIEYSINKNILSQKHILTRPTFAQIFDWANEVTDKNDINIVANSDIYFDGEGIEIMNLLLGEGNCWALTRWDALTGEFMGRRDSQDSWIFRGHVKPGNYDFGVGLPGCDNKLAYELQQVRYEVTNPSRTIKTFHLHKGEDRKWHGKPQIPPPYLLLEPTTI